MIVPMLKPVSSFHVPRSSLGGPPTICGAVGFYINSSAEISGIHILRMSMDTETGFDWNRIPAMSLLAIIRSLAFGFFMAQIRL